MKVRSIRTGEVKAVDDSYGVRLIEQGQAIAVSEAETRPERKAAAKADAKPDAKPAAGK